MYHVDNRDVHAGDILFPFCDRASACANNVSNVTNYYIRNLMTGLKKAPSERTKNEADVIAKVNGSIQGINAALKEKHSLRVKNIVSSGRYKGEALEEKLSSVKCLQFEELTPENWYAGYSLLDAVFRYTENADYRAFHIHVIQNAIKERCGNWSGYFKSLRSYKTGEEGFTGKPRIPGYKKSGGRSTAVFSNLACSRKHGRLFFPYCMEADAEGKERRIRHSIDISMLPHASEDKLIEVRVVPYFGSYRIQIVTDDGLSEEDLIPKEEDIISSDGTPAGVMTLDPGLTNFAAIADNKGHTPIVIKGGALKARNQWYNKRMAFLKSEQMKGHIPGTRRPSATKQMQRLSRKREDFLRDTFYKYAHYICRLAEERELSFIIVGHNKGQKQGISLGSRTNQAFVQIPFEKFSTILVVTAVKYGIRVIFQEESYTSKACFGSRDSMPVYGAEDAGKAVFTGRRVKRGLYRQDDGKVLNADINGSANIGRKYDERIFPEDMDCSYLYGTVKAVRYDDILEESHRHHRTSDCRKEAVSA